MNQTSEFDRLLDQHLAPILMAQGFRRRRRLFVRDTSAAVSGIALKLGSGGTRATLELGVAYRDWNKLLGSTQALKDPVQHGDWVIRVADPDSPFGPATEKWWTAGGDTDFDRIGKEMTEALTQRALPALAAREQPTADLEGLAKLFDRGTLKNEPLLLSRLYLWLLTLEGDTERRQAVKRRLVELGQTAMLGRIEERSGG